VSSGVVGVDCEFGVCDVGWGVTGCEAGAADYCCCCHDCCCYAENLGYVKCEVVLGWGSVI